MTKTWFKIIDLLFIKVKRAINMALKFSCCFGINVARRKVEGITCHEKRRILDHYENEVIHPHGAYKCFSFYYFVVFFIKWNNELWGTHLN
jgi:hypothetical protein